jgi:N-acetylmuramic acid 6-phosphate etherase
VDRIVQAIQNHGRLFYIGAGTSGRLAVIDAAELFPTFGVGSETVRAIIAGGRRAMFRPVEGIEDNEVQAKFDLQRSGFSRRDVLLGISASGRTPYVVAALEYAEGLGAGTIALTSNPDSRITKTAGIVICPKTGAEVIAGSTRMKAGTAQKLVLNMISTTAMIRLGKIHGNLMVSLKPVSAKLAERQVRILMQATSLSRKESKNILAKARGNVKIAILMAKAPLDFSSAKKLLEKSGGSLEMALLSPRKGKV